MNHPLTDEMIDELAQFNPDLTGEQVVNRDHDMRAAADWQLEQVKKIVELKVEDMYRSGYKGTCVDLVYRADVIEEFFEGIMQELRPQEES